MGIDVCIVTYHNTTTLRRLLDSLLTSLPAGSRCSLWDNSPNMETAVFAEHLAGQTRMELRVIRSDRNIGFGAACNRLAELSHRDQLLFINPDAWIVAWPDDLADAAGVLIGPSIVDDKGSPQVTSGRSRNLVDELRVRLLRRPRPRPCGRAGEVGYVSGACMFLNREKFLEIGGFDERMYMYYEDIDLCRRWRRSGGRVLQDQSFIVGHTGAHSASADRSLALRRSYDSACTFHRKWHGAVGLYVFQVIAGVEAVAKLLLALPAHRVGRVTLGEQWQLIKHIFGLSSTDEPGEPPR